MKDYYQTFSTQDLRLKTIYKSGILDSFPVQVIQSSKIQDIYGPLRFPPLPEQRCYSFGSFVQSVDGKISYPQSPDGTLIARSNGRDPDGGRCDYWILNLLRSCCDCVLMGTATLAREPRLTGLVHDKDLEDARVAAGKERVPTHVVVSGSGRLPPGHALFSREDIPLIVLSSPEGARRIAESGGPGGSGQAVQREVLVTGSDETIDVPRAMELLKERGMDTMLVESPSFLMSLMEHRLLDELFLNSSGLFVGREGLSIGRDGSSFTDQEHPALRTLSIHAHSDYFFYTRYALEYGEEEA